MALGHSVTWPLQLVEALKELNHLSATIPVACIGKKKHLARRLIATHQSTPCFARAARDVLQGDLHSAPNGTISAILICIVSSQISE